MINVVKDNEKDEKDNVVSTLSNVFHINIYLLHMHFSLVTVRLCLISTTFLGTVFIRGGRLF